MNYKALSTSFIIDEYRTQLDFAPPILMGRRYSGGIPDDYDKLPDFGLMSDDFQRSLKHALGIASKISNKKYEHDDKKFLANQLCNDLRNVLLLVNSHNPPDDDDIRVIIQTIIYLKEFEQVTQIIRDYYKTYCDDIDEDTINPTMPFALDYEDLYIKAGDAALFLYEDPSLATQFYDLADLDWLGIRDRRFNVDRDDRVKRLESWHDTNDILFEIEYWISEEDRLKKLIKDDYILDQFVVLQKLLADKKNRADELISCADSIVTSICNYLNNKPQRNDSTRAYVLLGYAAKRMSLLDSLCSLFSEDKNKRVSYLDSVWKSISLTFEPRLDVIKKYAAESEKNAKNLDVILSLAKTVSITGTIKEELKVEESNQPVAYYTSLENFFFMLPDKCKNSENLGKLSIMNISYMNDPNEGKTIQEYITGGSRVEMYEERKVVSVPYVFMKCFTKQIDYLPMWEMYANHAEGCCIVLDWNRTTEKANIPLYRVCYIKKHNSNRRTINKTDNALISDGHLIERCLQSLRHIYQKMRDEKAKDAFDAALGEVKYLFKDSSYSYEQEMRILSFFSQPDEKIQHTGGDYPKLFVYSNVPIQIKEIVLAPKFENLADKIPYIEEQIEKMCKSVGTAMPKITISNIDYR